MGTFGLGGLHRKSTWLFPVPTVAALPATAVPGSVAIALDTNHAYEYDATVPGWTLLADGPGGGGSGGGLSFFDDFVPTPGQTVFTLTLSPTNLNSVVAVLNSVLYYPPASFSIGGAGNRTITWTSLIPLDSSDSLRIYY
jgi:hypothetical protein